MKEALSMSELPDINTGWKMKRLRAALLRRTWGYWEWKAGHKQTMCAHSPESQPDPGLHQKKHGQQGKWDDSASLLYSSEASPGVLCPALEPSAQGRHGPVGADPEEGHKNRQRAGTPLLWGKTERVGVIQPGEEKAAETLLQPFNT